MPQQPFENPDVADTPDMFDLIPVAIAAGPAPAPGYLGGPFENPDAADSPDMVDGPVQSNSAAPAYPQTGSIALVTTDFDAVRALAGVSGQDWPDNVINLPMYLGGAVLGAMRRVPCDWTLLDAVSTQYLKLALIYETASLIVPAANPTKTEDFKVGSFSLKTDDTALLGDANTLMGWANQYYSNVVLPPNVLPLAVVDGYARPMIRKANVGRKKLFGCLK